MVLRKSTRLKSKINLPTKDPTLNKPRENDKELNPTSVATQVTLDPPMPKKMTPHNVSTVEENPKPSNKGRVGKEPMEEVVVNPTVLTDLQV